MARSMKSVLSLLEAMASDFQKLTQTRLNLSSPGAAANFNGVGSLLKARDEVIKDWQRAERDLVGALEIAREALAGDQFQCCKGLAPISECECAKFSDQG